MKIIKHLLGLLAGAFSGYAIARFLYISKISVVNVINTHIEFNPAPYVIAGSIIGLIFPWLAIISCILIIVFSSR